MHQRQLKSVTRAMTAGALFHPSAAVGAAQGRNSQVTRSRSRSKSNVASSEAEQSVCDLKAFAI
jgi:hypothetical protein